MRLTLRTMLAYLDDILDPEEQEDIGRKIEESEFASELVHRTRDVTRRLRLGAPHLAGRGMGLDPNTVAEYLDNTLAPERVADFERVCLESDEHLAETASCHQILTLVLGEPAEVDVEARRRMYAIPATAEQWEREGIKPAGSPTEPISREPTLASGLKTKKRAKPTVPDYLRKSSRSRFRRVAKYLFVAAALLGIAYMGFGPDGNEGPGVEAPEVDMGMAFDPGAAPGELSGSPDFSDTTPPDFSTPSSEGAATNEPVAADRTSTADALPSEPLASDAERVDAHLVPGSSTDATAKQAATVVSEETPGISDVASSKPPEEPAVLPAEPASPPLKEPSRSVERVGTYVSDKAVLLRHDQKTDDWRRLPSRAALSAGDRLLALPTFRPTIALGSGVTLQLAGGSAVVLEGTDAEGIPAVTIEYGRLVMLNVGQAANRLRIGLGQHAYLVSFEEGATLAIELRHVHTPGVDPRTVQAPMVVNLYATRGKLRWDTGDAAVDIEAPRSWQLPDGGSGSTEAGAPPEWIDSEKLGQIERQASFTLEQALALDRSASLTLSELVDRQGVGRRAEVWSLAAQCSVYVGQFEPFVTALNDPAQRSQWLKHIESLRESLVLGPEVAEKIHAAFERQLGEDSDELYRMLWAYGPENLRQETARMLVHYLDHDRLDFRVLALWNLKQITGLGMPRWLQDPRADRRRSVRRWKDRLAKGEVIARKSAAKVPLGKEPTK